MKIMLLCPPRRCQYSEWSHAHEANSPSLCRPDAVGRARDRASRGRRGGERDHDQRCHRIRTAGDAARPEVREGLSPQGQVQDRPGRRQRRHRRRRRRARERRRRLPRSPPQRPHRAWTSTRSPSTSCASSPTRPTRSRTSPQAQAQAIFTGKVRDWSQVPGASANGTDRRLSAAPPSAGVLTTFQNTLLGGAKASPRSPPRSPARGFCSRTVKKDPNADRLPLGLLRAARRASTPSATTASAASWPTPSPGSYPGVARLLRGHAAAPPPAPARPSSTGS